MKKNRLKKYLDSILNNIKNMFSFYYIWVTIFLIIIAVIALKISIYYNAINNEFYASMYSNIFSGIIVGLVVFFVTGFKNLQKYDLETKISKMERIHKEIIEYRAMYRKLLVNKNIEDYKDMAYDLICKAQFINTEIYSTSNTKSKNFFLKEFSFNAVEKSNECSNIREIILYDIDSDNYRKNVNKHLGDYEKELLLLNNKILIKMRDYNSKIRTIDTSIL